MHAQPRLPRNPELNQENNISVECSTIFRLKFRKQQIYNDEVNFQFTKFFEKLSLFVIIALMEDFHWSSISHDAKPTTQARLNMFISWVLKLCINRFRFAGCGPRCSNYRYATAFANSGFHKLPSGEPGRLKTEQTLMLRSRSTPAFFQKFCSILERN